MGAASAILKSLHLTRLREVAEERQEKIGADEATLTEVSDPVEPRCKIKDDPDFLNFQRVLGIQIPDDIVEKSLFAARTDFTGLILTDSQISAFHLNCSFVSSSLKSNLICDSAYWKCDFSGASIESCDFENVLFRDCCFGKIEVDPVTDVLNDLGDVKQKATGYLEIFGRIIGSIFKDCVVMNCLFQEQKISNSSFKDADLRGSVFRQCHFDNVDMSGADLRGAKFIDCTGLDAVDFEGAIVGTITESASPIKFCLRHQRARVNRMRARSARTARFH